MSLNTTTKIVTLSSDRDKHLEKLFRDCVIEGDAESCNWFKTYFHDYASSKKCFYSNCWDIANLCD